MRVSQSVVFFALATSGCASYSSYVVPEYIPPVQYASFSCPQLTNEAYRIAGRMTYLVGIQDEHARNDAIAATLAAIGIGAGAAGVALRTSSTMAPMVAAGGGAVGVGSLLFIHGNDPQTVELARAKGELDAVERAFVLNGCPYGQPPPPVLIRSRS